MKRYPARITTQIILRRWVKPCGLWRRIGIELKVWGLRWVTADFFRSRALSRQVAFEAARISRRERQR